MPNDPAILVIIVLPFLVKRFLKERFNAVKKLIELSFSLRFFAFFSFLVSSIISSFLTSSSLFAWKILSSDSLLALIFSVLHVSDSTSPSLNLMILSEYLYASSWLWVTMMTSLSLDISFKMSMTWTDVIESRAPVGSSAKIISGSLMIARAIATLCIWPPLNWFGFLLKALSNPTIVNAFLAFSIFSFFETPLSVKDIATFSTIVSCGIKL